ncbi:hypothetical protein ONZ45_g13720 [Pleurotus djamor]|nr:hypothetical protein ONZ45_g13720 [Pleurotus djamor]
MSHTSPASYLVWSVIATLLGIFLVYHLWSFDRFKCLKWNNGPNSGAFKRVMTYSYLLSVPLIMGYAIGFAVIKYREGYVDMPLFGIMPKPWQLWDSTSRSAIFPLLLLFSLAWGLEMVTHLEELCFWLFLINAGSTQQDWFRTLYFKIWIVGSFIGITYMPLVTIFTREDPLKCEAYTALAGSLGSLSLTLWFTPVLWTFPSFLENLRTEGVDTATVVRLTKFHELNTLRVIFRFLFVVPLLILGVDGVRPHAHINENFFATDFLMMVAGFGCAISSAITLVIFFPRSVEGEIASREASREARQKRMYGLSSGMAESGVATQSNVSFQPQLDPKARFSGSSFGGNYAEQTLTLPPVDARRDPYNYPISPSSMSKYTEDGDYVTGLPKHIPPSRAQRKRGPPEVDMEMDSIPSSTRLTETNLSVHNLRNVNPMVQNFTSPIVSSMLSNNAWIRYAITVLAAVVHVAYAATISSTPAQTFTGVGGSGAWWPMDLFHFPESVRQNLSTLLFSDSGLGLSSYRWNVGAGGVSVANRVRAPETFYVSQGVFDWSKDPQGLYFLNEAAKRGVPMLTAFANSAPAPLTAGKTSCNSNFVTGSGAAYGAYLADVIQHFRNQGIPITLVSPMNEPDSNFGPAPCQQEGMQVVPSQRAEVVRELYNALAARGLQNTVGILADESSSLGNARNEYASWLPQVINQVAALVHHTYDFPSDDSYVSFVNNVKSAFPGKVTWMSSFNVAGEPHYDFWTLVSNGLGCSPLNNPSCVNNANGAGWNDGLIYYDGNYANNGNFQLYLTKHFWTYKHLGNFVKPGSQRRVITGSDANRLTLAVSTSSNYYILAINPNSGDSNFTLQFPDAACANGAFRTSASEDFASVAGAVRQGSNWVLSLRSMSLTTYVFSRRSC